MIILLQYLLTLIFGYNIIKARGWERLVWFLASITLVSTSFNFLGAIAITKGHKIFVLFFLFSLFNEGKLKLKYLKQCPLFLPLMIVFASYIMIGLFDERLNPAMGIYRGVYNYMVTYGAFFLGWLSVYDKINYDKLSKKLINIGLIFTLYGLFCFSTKSNPVVDALGFENRFVFEDAEVAFRSFLVSGFLSESGVYGLSCLIFMLFIWSINTKNNTLQYISLCILFINIFLTGTRSIMIPAVVGIIIYILTRFNIKKKIQLLGLGLLFFATITIIFPHSVGSYAGDIISSMIDVISPSGSGGADLGGSSLDVRDIQITTAFVKYLPQKPFFGHGFNYYQEVILVFNGGVNDVELFGMESYLCFLGVEYGLVNIIAVISFFISLIIYFIRNRQVNKATYSFAISLTIAFVIYLATAFMGDSWLYAMPVLGFLTGIIEYKKRNNAAIVTK